MDPTWTSDRYHWTHFNCLSFARIFLTCLGAENEIPTWVRNLCEISRRSWALDFIADSFWVLKKRWTSTLDEDDDFSLQEPVKLTRSSSLFCMTPKACTGRMCETDVKVPGYR